VLQQRRLATDLQARRLDLQVGLIKALGGGYQEPPEGHEGEPPAANASGSQQHAPTAAHG
jgi:hypothetical protein